MKNRCIKFILFFSLIILSLNTFSTLSFGNENSPKIEQSVRVTTLSMPDSYYVSELESVVIQSCELINLSTGIAKPNMDRIPLLPCGQKADLDSPGAPLEWEQTLQAARLGIKDEQQPDRISEINPQLMKPAAVEEIHVAVPPLSLEQINHHSTKTILGHLQKSTNELEEEKVEQLTNTVDRKFIGMNAFVTGITSGIGLELIDLLFQKGINVIGVGRSEEKLKDLKNLNTEKRKTHKAYGILHPITADLSKVEQIEHISSQVENILKDQGKLNLVVFNAATIVPNGLEALFNYPVETINETLVTNATSVVLLTSKLTCFYAKQARLLYLSSIAGERPGGGTLLYSITKAMIDQLVRGLRKDRSLRKGTPLPETTDLVDPWGKLDLLPACVNPGNVETPIHSRDLRGADPVAMPRVEFFQSMEGKLLAPNIAGMYLCWLLTTASTEQYLEKDKHTIYDLVQQKLWWKGEPIVDPYATSPANITSLIPTPQVQGLISSPHSLHSPTSSLNSPSSISSGLDSISDSPKESTVKRTLISEERSG